MKIPRPLLRRWLAFCTSRIDDSGKYTAADSVTN